MKLLYSACAPRRFWALWIGGPGHNGRLAMSCCLGRALPPVIWLSLLWGAAWASRRSSAPSKGWRLGRGGAVWRPRSSASGPSRSTRPTGHRHRRGAFGRGLHRSMLVMLRRSAKGALTRNEFEASTIRFPHRVRLIFFVAIVLIRFTSW
jgi:hypothetical protein